MKLRSKQGFIRAGEPETIRKKKHIDRYIYFGIIIVIIIAGLYLLSRKIFYVTGYGQVIIPYVDVQPIDDIRILKYYVKEGDYVKQGDIIFSYTERQRDAEITPNVYYQVMRDRENQLRQVAKMTIEKRTVERTSELSIAKLNNDLEWKKQEKNYYQNLLKRKIEELEHVKKMVLLETYLPYEIKNKEEEIEKMKFQIAKIDSDISSIEKEIELLKEKKENYTFRS